MSLCEILRVKRDCVTNLARRDPIGLGAKYSAHYR